MESVAMFVNDNWASQPIQENCEYYWDATPWGLVIVTGISEEYVASIITVDKVTLH